LAVVSFSASRRPAEKCFGPSLCRSFIAENDGAVQILQTAVTISARSRCRDSPAPPSHPVQLIPWPSARRVEFWLESRPSVVTTTGRAQKFPAHSTASSSNPPDSSASQ